MSTQIVTPPPSVDQAQLAELVTKLASPIVEAARKFEVETEDDCLMAGIFLQGLQKEKKGLDRTFDVKNASTAHPIVLKAYAAFQAAKAAYAEVCKPYDSGMAELEEARRIVSEKILAFETKRAEEKRQEEARQAAEKKQQLDREATERAAQLEAAGESDLAQQVLQEAIDAPPPVVVLQGGKPDTGGAMQGRDNWKFEITNEREAFEHALKHDPEILSLDPVKIGQKTRSQKKLAIGKWPGIRVWNDRKFHGRA